MANRHFRPTGRALLIAALTGLLCIGCDHETLPETQAVLSMKQGGEWQGQKYAGGEWTDVTEVVAPPQATDHSEYLRFEGPGIESGLVGYRFYLDWRNGFDIYGKKTHELVLQNVGLDGYDSYHEPADWGMDILNVGDSLGMGAFGYWDGEAAQRVSDVDRRSARIVENGPERAAIELRYEGWQVADAKTDLTATLTMGAGSRLVDVSLELSASLPNVAIGIVKHPDAELSTGRVGDHAYLATWGPQSIVGDDLGMLLIYPQDDLLEITEDEHSHVVVLNPKDGSLEYRFGAAWGQEPGGIATEAEFLAYVEREAAGIRPR